MHTVCNARLDARELESEIQLAYKAWLAADSRIEKLGWRLLYSPRSVLAGARVAFIGLNPGGRFIDPDHGVFSAEKGSAYRREIENWRQSSRLQDQVISLFKRLGVHPEEVLAGNLVPFRSPGEKNLMNAAEAISFGESIWNRILATVQPSLVISMGETVNDIISRMLQVHNTKRYVVGWGRASASRGEFQSGTWIGLPHLSRFTIMTREASEGALDTLFEHLNTR